MKKSEMVNKLQDILINMGFKSEYKCGCCHFEPTLEQATEILDILETAGMIPPPYIKEQYVTFTNEEDAGLIINEWEPEDE